MSRILRKLLSGNINPWQTVAYTVANFIGLLIIGTGVQFYRDISNRGEAASDPLGATRFTVVSRQATASIFGTDNRNLSASEIEDISRQPWAKKAAPFTPAGFDISVSLDLGNAGFSTSLFFEGVPDEYLETVPSGWGFDPEAPEVSIILPRDYLALYNLGYAPARGLPSIDERTARMIPLAVTMSGKGISEKIPGRIVGFSSRINTIAVPDAFIRWANGRFSPAADPEIRRAVIELDDPGNPAFSRYLLENRLEESSADEATSRLCYFLRLITVAVTAIGILISIMAASLMILSVFLLLQKNRHILSDLITLGYAPSTLSGFYIRLVTIANLLSMIMAWAGVTAITVMWHDRTAELGMTPAPLSPTLLVIAVAAISLSVFSSLAVKRVIGK